MTEDETPPSVPASAATPAEHAVRLAVKPWQLAAATQLHGWLEHEHHAGTPIMLSEEAFQAAIAAACADTIEPHAPAVSPYRGKGL